jgi:hypothetical protein
MSEVKKTSATSPEQSAKRTSPTNPAVAKQLDKDADEMAGRAGKAESQYDENHDIFTK